MIPTRLFLLAAALIVGCAGPAAANEEDTQSKTVIGPRNPQLVNGAQALLHGDAEEGIRLTRLGLEVAQGRRERQAGLSNMCAGYVMLKQYEEALGFCNQALEENERNWRALCNRALINIYLERYAEAEIDLVRGEEIAPHARALKEVRGIYRDSTDPVQPSITIDDRRDADNDDNTDDG